MTDSATLHNVPAETYLGPETLLWRHAGDHRVALMVPATGMLLNMFPGVSEAITTQSVFFNDPFTRTARSVGEVTETIFDQELAHKVRDYHRNVKGTDHHGERYHALEPGLWFASHAVFIYSFSTFINTFVRPLSAAEQEQFYDECKIWYHRYGISDRHMPATWADFTVYWDDLCENVMEDTPVTNRIVNELYGNFGDYPPENFSPSVWRLLSPVIGDQTRLLTTALVPPVCREKLGLKYSLLDRARFEATVRASKAVWTVLPDRLHDTARTRFEKSRALRLASDTPGVRSCPTR